MISLCRHQVTPLVLLLLLQLSGCAVNPVTGEKELTLVSESQELAIGKKQYGPSRQMQGGDYRLDPKLTSYIQQVGQRLTAESDRKLPYEFVVINDAGPNAWALPGGKIAVNRGLLMELKNEAELAAVLGHEIVHAAARHGAKRVEKGLLLQGAVMAAGIATQDSDYTQLAVGAAAIGASLLSQRYSRDAELESDYYGMVYMVRAGYDPRAAVGLQETFVRLSKAGESNWLSGLFSSHPPSAERVAKNRETAEQLGVNGGELGERRYRRMLSSLRKAEPAYVAYRQGGEALQKKRHDQALSYAREAIAIEPAEALFHSLEGDALAGKKRNREALASYNRALARDDSFFRHYLKRGELRVKLGNRSGAKSDLEQSLSLLPTANAHHTLGRLALDENDRRSALTHFKAASTSSSATGKAAAKAFLQLDLPENPHRYIRSRLGMDKGGRLIVQLENPTSVTVERLRLQVGRMDAKGRLQRPVQYRVDRRLAPKDVIALRTRVGLQDRAELKQWGVQVIRAEVR
ncbi:MAG: M48 family metalloprotease [Candidatus Sedimenticola sp. (ex Thyasira tokunagai)]